MVYPKFILPLFASAQLIGQDNTSYSTDIEFGFTHATYTSLCFQKPTIEPHFKHEASKSNLSMPVHQCQYGYIAGFFLWVPVNKFLTIKPQIEMAFSNLAMRSAPRIYAKACDFGISNAFMFALKRADPNGIIYMARNMSCYLTMKQPYFLFGPKLNFKRYDKGFLHKGFQNELSVGAFVGYGINYEFHGTNIAPEIKYSIESTAQNAISEIRKISHTISIAINIF